MTTLKQQWIDALYSETYVQTKSVLHNAQGFCCLGVLADVAGCTWIPMESGAYKAVFNDDRFGGFVSKPIQRAVNIDMIDQHTLSSLNDAYGLSFAEIADYILHCQYAGILLHEGMVTTPEAP